MRRYFPGFLLLVIATGCASIAGPPPSPPLAVPAVGAPKEFTWSPLKWRPGLVLTYHVHSFMEINTGGSEQSRSLVQLKGADKTAKGAVRVQLLVDNLEIGSMLIDEFGNFQDALASKPEFAPVFTVLAEWMQALQLSQLQSKPFAVGETLIVDVPTTANFRRLMPQDWGRYLVPSINIRWQFTGYVRLGETLAAAFRAEIPNILSSPIHGRDRNSREFRIDAFVGEVVDYLDAIGGYSLAQYEVLTGGGEAGGKPFSYRSVKLTTLDRERSSTDKPPGSISPDIETRLRRLQDLREKKLITEEEYQAHRKELLKELVK